MRGKSHRCLGQYLVQHYMGGVSPACIRAFLLGCIQPDKNPATYLKGSLHHQWLRGHNYRNARRFMGRIACRLERRRNLNLYDYYTLGKLIHYTADAFTCAHNDMFPTDLAEHREYEGALQDYFLSFLQKNPKIDPDICYPIMEAISRYHQEYCTLPSDVHTDSRFALNACCCVLAVLFLKPI